MNNPLDDVPLNTKRVYVMAKTTNGCEVYMPVDSDNDINIQRKKIELQNFLNYQGNLHLPDSPLLA